MKNPAAIFEEHYRRSDDPWGFRSRWYERRKRALLCACLPAERFENAWEIGCSNGELAAALAPACDRLLATDGNAIAVGIARDRLSEFSTVRVQQMWIPEAWPEERFDLVVLSEMAYYLDAAALTQFCGKLISSISPTGHFVACHWRPRIADGAITGDEAHDLMTPLLPWQKTVRHFEDDFRLEIWSAQNHSVAELEGLR